MKLLVIAFPLIVALAPRVAAAVDPLKDAYLPVEVKVVNGQAVSVEGGGAYFDGEHVTVPISAQASCGDQKLEMLWRKVTAGDSNNASTEVLLSINSPASGLGHAYAWTGPTAIASKYFLLDLCDKAGVQPTVAFEMTSKCAGKQKKLYRAYQYSLTCEKASPPAPPSRGGGSEPGEPPPPECRKDADCGRNRHCARGTCLDGPRDPACTVDADCGRGKQCKRGACVEPQPR